MKKALQIGVGVLVMTSVLLFCTQKMAPFEQNDRIEVNWKTETNSSQQPNTKTPNKTTPVKSAFDRFAEEYQLKYKRTLPKHMNKWFEFAQENQCELHEYHMIESFLSPFRKTGLSQANLNEIQVAVNEKWMKLKRVRIQNGVANSHKWNLHTFSHLLPDLTFYANTWDEPRVYHCREATQQSCNTKGPHYSMRGKYLHACKFPHGNLTSLMNSHGSFMYPGPYTFRKVPIFSATRIDQCQLDILMPYIHGYNLWKPSLLTSDVPWESKVNEIIWRGSSTGIYVQSQFTWEKSHRFRMIAKFGPQSNHSYLNTTPPVKANIAFTAIKQTSEAWVKKLAVQKYGPIARRIPFESNFKRKFILDIDGNSFSARFTSLLRSNSLIFKATIHSVWYSEWLKPWIHFIPVDISLEDLEEKIQWALDNDKKAKIIAENGGKLAASRLRVIDMDCYLARLLIEYASLFGH